LDGAVTVSDEEAVNMAHYLLRHEGLSVGPSAALNVAAATKLALRNRHSGLAIVTILCDGGERNASKLYSSDYLAAQGLTPKAPLPDPSEDLLQFLSPENT
jgi:cysteine synthase